MRVQPFWRVNRCKSLDAVENTRVRVVFLLACPVFSGIPSSNTPHTIRPQGVYVAVVFHIVKLCEKSGSHLVLLFQVVDARAGPGTKSMMKMKSRNIKDTKFKKKHKHKSKFRLAKRLGDDQDALSLCCTYSPFPPVQG